MARQPDPDKLKGPGGLTMRQLHEQVKKSAMRDRLDVAKKGGSHARKDSRWQRFMRYVWGRSGRR